VTEVEDTVPKIACAGWFFATGKSFLAEVAGLLNTQVNRSGR
jgi:hypothetical protein